MNLNTNVTLASLLLFNSKTLETSVIPLKQKINTIGRLSENKFTDIEIDSNIVSKFHGVISQDENGWNYIYCCNLG